MSAPRAAEIRSALCAVHDPCSVASNVPLNILDMGLVREWSVDASRVSVRLVLTSAICIHVPALVEAVRTALMQVSGVGVVEVEIDHATLWDPSDMSPRARAAIARRRQATLVVTGARPQQWRETLA